MSESNITQVDYDRAADLAALAEAIGFGGNDVAALRHQFTADDQMLEFVRLVRAHRLATIEQCREAIASQQMEDAHTGYALTVGDCLDILRNLEAQA